MIKQFECGMIMESVHRWNTGSWIWSLAIWKDFLCSGLGSDIIQVWSDYGTLSRTLKGRTDDDPVTCLLVHETFLYSGSSDFTIRKWSISGQCLTVMEGHTDWIGCLVVYRGDLYSGSDDKIIRRWTLD